MQSYYDGATVFKSEHNHGLAGTGPRAAQLATLLGNIRDVRNVAILTEAVERLEARKDFDGYRDLSNYLPAILSYGDAAHDFIAPRVRRGDAETLYALSHAGNEGYVADFRAMLDSDASANAWHWAIQYLWNIDSPEAVDLLREIYERGIPAGDESQRTRLRLAAALAYRGDHRGLPAALEELKKLVDAGHPPVDEDARKKWKRQIDDRRRDALDVFDRAGTKGVAEFLTKHAGEESPTTRLALLEILALMHPLPDAVRPHVEKWAADASSQRVAEQAKRLLSRQE
jgi:hypothetical protein